MLIEIHELETHAVEFVEQFEPGAIDLGEEVRQTAVLKTAGRAQLVREHHGKHILVNDIRVAGDLSTKVEVICARCLEPVIAEVAKKFHPLYRPHGTYAGQARASATASETQQGYNCREGLLLQGGL